MTRLSAAFFHRHTLEVARDLLGKYLVFGACAGQIIETEAYRSVDDESCHAHRGMTQRNATMFKPGGHLYVYRIHQVFCLNIVTEAEGLGCAVLIRAVVPTAGIEQMARRRGEEWPLEKLADGPGKLCQAFGIDITHDGICLTDSGSPIWLEDRSFQYAPNDIMTTPRIGISKATELPWRFIVPKGKRTAQHPALPDRP